MPDTILLADYTSDNAMALTLCVYTTFPILTSNLYPGWMSKSKYRSISTSSSSSYILMEMFSSAGQSYPQITSGSGLKFKNCSAICQGYGLKHGCHHPTCQQHHVCPLQYRKFPRIQSRLHFHMVSRNLLTRYCLQHAQSSGVTVWPPSIKIQLQPMFLPRPYRRQCRFLH